MGIFSIFLGFILGAAILGGFISSLIENRLGAEVEGVCVIPFIFGFCLFGIEAGSIIGGFIGAIVFAFLFKR